MCRPFPLPLQHVKVLFRALYLQYYYYYSMGISLVNLGKKEGSERCEKREAEDENSETREETQREVDESEREKQMIVIQLGSAFVRGEDLH